MVKKESKRKLFEIICNLEPTESPQHVTEEVVLKCARFERVWYFSKFLPYMSSDALIKLVKKIPYEMMREQPYMIPQEGLEFCFKKHPFAAAYFLGHYATVKMVAQIKKKFPQLKYNGKGFTRTKSKLSHEGIKKIKFELGICKHEGLGHKFSFKEAEPYISNRTLVNLMTIANTFKVTWNTAYFFQIERRWGHHAWSILFVGVDTEGNTLVYSRRETENLAAGQTKMYFEGHAPEQVSYLIGATKFEIKEWKEKGKRLKKEREEKKRAFI